MNNHVKESIAIALVTVAGMLAVTFLPLDNLSFSEEEQFRPPLQCLPAYQSYKGEILMTTPNTPNMGNPLSENVFETGGVWSNQDAEEDTEVEVDLSDGEEFDLPTEEEVDPKSRIEL